MPSTSPHFTMATTGVAVTEGKARGLLYSVGSCLCEDPVSDRGSLGRAQRGLCELCDITLPCSFGGVAHVCMHTTSRTSPLAQCNNNNYYLCGWRLRRVIGPVVLLTWAVSPHRPPTQTSCQAPGNLYYAVTTSGLDTLIHEYFTHFQNMILLVSERGNGVGVGGQEGPDPP